MFEVFLDPFVDIFIVAVVAIISVIFIRFSYTVVPPHEAHVVVSRNKGRKLFCSRVIKDQKLQSSYWYIPILQQRLILPLENIRIQINNIPLRDMLMAKFSGDVICYITISDPMLAAEKLGHIESEETRTDVTQGIIVSAFPSVGREIGKMIEAITRNASMSMEIYDIMKHRDQFSGEVKDRVNGPVKEWGIQLTALEVIHFTDVEGYTVIKDLETRQAVLINTETRKQVANNEKDASVVESVANKEKESAKAENEESYRVRQIQRDRSVGQSQQDANKAIAESQEKANKQVVQANRVLTVGNAEVTKDALIAQAQGEGEATRQKGFAVADVTQRTLFAEAAGTEKKALALKQYNDAGISLEMIKASVSIEQARFTALGNAMSQGKVSVITGAGEGANILGIPITPQMGASFGQMLEALAAQGVDKTVLEGLLASLPIKDSVKAALATKIGIEATKSAIDSVKKESKK